MYVNIALALFEDVPMGTLTFVYVMRLDGKPETMQLVSMMMSAGMVYLKCGKLLNYKNLLDDKKDLTSRIEHTMAKLTAEEQAATVQADQGSSAWLPWAHKQSAEKAQALFCTEMISSDAKVPA